MRTQQDSLTGWITAVNVHPGAEFRLNEVVIRTERGAEQTFHVNRDAWPKVVEILDGRRDSFGPAPKVFVGLNRIDYGLTLGKSNWEIDFIRQVEK